MILKANNDDLEVIKRIVKALGILNFFIIKTSQLLFSIRIHKSVRLYTFNFRSTAGIHG